MSAWRLLVREIAERGPITARQVSSIGTDVEYPLKRAMQLGLLAWGPTADWHGAHRIVLTRLGRWWATGRVVDAAGLHQGPRRGGTAPARFRASWLAPILEHVESQRAGWMTPLLQHVGTGRNDDSSEQGRLAGNGATSAR